jgi:hypothetical protein
MDATGPPNEAVENMAPILLRTGNEYKADHHGPLQVDRVSPRLLPVVLEDQLVPGSFAHAVHH